MTDRYLSPEISTTGTQRLQLPTSQKDASNYFIEIEDQILPENIEYKFTKGGWENVELDQYGNITPTGK
jgi:hypothetical protein